MLRHTNVSIPKLLRAKSRIALQNAMIWNILVSVVEKNCQIEKVERYRAIAKPVECRMLTFYSKKFVSYGDKRRDIVFFGIQYLKSACLGRKSNIPKSPKSLLITVSTGPPHHIAAGISTSFGAATVRHSSATNCSYLGFGSFITK
jgi:hypothetical protein